MKQTMKILLALLLCACMLMLLAACKGQTDTEQPQQGTQEGEQTGDQTDGEVQPTGVWADATYLSDQEFGEGEKTIQVKLIVEGQSITFTVHTNAQTLSQALEAHQLIEGEEGPYGLYVKKVNGMTADYDVNRRYWSLTKGGEYMMTGMDMTDIADGEHYEITYAK